MRSWLVTESGLGVIIVRVESHLAQVQGYFASSRWLGTLSPQDEAPAPRIQSRKGSSRRSHFVRV